MGGGLAGVVAVGGDGDGVVLAMAGVVVVVVAATAAAVVVVIAVAAAMKRKLLLWVMRCALWTARTWHNVQFFRQAVSGKQRARSAGAQHLSVCSVDVYYRHLATHLQPTSSLVESGLQAKQQAVWLSLKKPTGS